MYDTLNAEFIRGYTKAIMDIQYEFDCVQNDLAGRKKSLTYKLAKLLLQIFLENRAVFRKQDNSPQGDRLNAFIRWNTTKNTLEFYSPKPRVRAILSDDDKDCGNCKNSSDNDEIPEVCRQCYQPTHGAPTRWEPRGEE